MHNIFAIPGQLIEESCPDLASFFLGEVAVIERDVDTGDESIVEGSNAVGCQEEDTLAIFHCAEEAYVTLVSIAMVYGFSILQRWRLYE